MGGEPQHEQRKHDARSRVEDQSLHLVFRYQVATEHARDRSQPEHDQSGGSSVVHLERFHEGRNGLIGDQV